MTHNPRSRRALIAAATIGAGAVLAACGGSSSKAASNTATPVTARTASARRFLARTPNPAIETSIAEGTPAPFGRGFSPAIQTSIAEGTPAPFRNAPPAVQTSIAEGTPRAGGGFRVRAVTLLATVLNVPASQLQTELQAPGATIASVAAAHGFVRDAVRQALIDAAKQRFSQQVQSGAITQDQATQAETQFESGIDAMLDSNGTPPGASASPAP